MKIEDLCYLEKISRRLTFSIPVRARRDGVNNWGKENLKLDKFDWKMGIDKSKCNYCC